jgi:NAD-dependent deacetylase
MPNGSTISDELKRKLRTAQSVFVLTGAGISAESGVPTFRGGGGAAVWKGMPLSVISSAEMVARDLKEVWAWFDYRRGVVGKVEPNEAHHALARWQDAFRRFALVTQNIDGLHEAAGSREVQELHGNIWRARCVKCNARRDLRDEEMRPPVCHACGDRMRPDVVLFGESLPEGVYERAARAAATCDVCFVIGTSALVYPAAGLPEIAAGTNAYLVEVNPERTPLSNLCDEVIEGRAGEILPLFGI